MAEAQRRSRQHRQKSARRQEVKRKMKARASAEVTASYGSEAHGPSRTWAVRFWHFTTLLTKSKTAIYPTSRHAGTDMNDTEMTKDIIVFQASRALRPYRSRRTCRA